jgi:broad specificity phosphatase PhoE
MSKTVILYAARHGQTLANAQNRFRGALDVPLDATGKADAENLADYFKDIQISSIIYSDKKRSTETANIIARSKPGIKCFGTCNLHAWNVGMFSGQPKSPENVQKLEHYIQNPDIPIPNGESLNEFKARIRPCLIEGMEIANGSGAPVLFVVHSSVIHEIGAMVSGSHSAVLVEPGGVACIYVEGENLGALGLRAKPLLRPVAKAPALRADTIS